MIFIFLPSLADSCLLPPLDKEERKKFRKNQKAKTRQRPLQYDLSPPLGDCVAIRNPGQIPQSQVRAGIQNDLIFCNFPGFPFDFAQDREPVERPVEPRVSPGVTVLSNQGTASGGGG
jgi:hypothetical protein